MGFSPPDVCSCYGYFTGIIFTATVPPLYYSAMQKSWVNPFFISFYENVIYWNVQIYEAKTEFVQL